MASSPQRPPLYYDHFFGGQSKHQLLVKPLYNGHFLLPQDVRCGEVQLYANQCHNFTNLDLCCHHFSSLFRGKKVAEFSEQKSWCLSSLTSLYWYPYNRKNNLLLNGSFQSLKEWWLGQFACLMKVEIYLFIYHAFNSVF